MNKKEYHELWFFINDEMIRLNDHEDVEETKRKLLDKLGNIYFKGKKCQ